MIHRLAPPELPDWLSSQLPFDRYMLDVEGVRMHVMEQGEGRPVVMFHGNPTWGYVYRRVAEHLTGERLRLIMPDMVGFGLSDRPNSSSEHTLANHSRWMSSLVASLDLRDAIAVVQDWGGAIGMLTMMNNDGLMTGLVVLNTMLGPPKPGFTPTRFHRVLSGPLGPLIPWQNHLWFAQGDRTSIRGVVQRSYSYPLKKAQGGRDAVMEMIRIVPDTLEHPSVPLLQDVEDFVAAYTGPSAIVWGRNDPILGKILRRINRQLPNAVVTDTDAGHFIQEQKPGDIAAAIRLVAAS